MKKTKNICPKKRNCSDLSISMIIIFIPLFFVITIIIVQDTYLLILQHVLMFSKLIARFIFQL